MEIATQEYKKFITDIKSKIKSSQLKAYIKVNSELLYLYWDIAKMIVEKQKQSSWGDKILEKISKDLKSEFPNMDGFSVRNIKYMRQWFKFYSIGQQAVAQIFEIPWGHNIHIVSKSRSLEEAYFYVKLTIDNNYSRAQLVEQIKKDLYVRNGKALTNFEAKLPANHSQLAQEILKDPYNFDFLGIRQEYDEKELEDALVENITKFLLELGSGFSFLGRQYKLVVDKKDFKIDLLFYHVKLHCFVVVELKTTEFKAEYAGKLNFYVSAVDGEIKSESDNPTIGLLICKSKSNTIVEYAFNGINKPIGISEYDLMDALPKEFKSSLPSIEQIEAEFKEFDSE